MVPIETKYGMKRSGGLELEGTKNHTTKNRCGFLLIAKFGMKNPRASLCNEKSTHIPEH
jgi:hypothetical protein